MERRMVVMTPKRISNLEEIFCLTAKGINEPNDMGETPIFIATRTGLLDIVEKILEGKPDLSHRNQDNDTVLIMGSCIGSAAIVRSLIDAGAGLDDQDNEGQTPLIIAVRNNHPGVAQELIKAGANLNIRDRQGFTAITRAAYTSKKELLEILMDTDADFTGLEKVLSDRRNMDNAAEELKQKISQNIAKNS